MSLNTLFPAWVAHSRMGHNVLYGYATPFVGTSILLECPAIDGDEDYAPIAAEVHVLPLEGPAFYGLQVVDEATVRDRRARGRDWIGGRRALSVATEPDVAVALDCKPVGTLMSEFTAEDLDALPDGSTFSDDDDSWERVGDEWVNDDGLSPCTSIQLRTHWASGLSYALTRIGAAPEAGRLLRNFTVGELDALPEGSRFFDASDDTEYVRDGGGWWSPTLTNHDSAGLLTEWACCAFRLTRIGPAPEPISLPSSDVRPAAAVGQRVFVGGLSPNTAGWYDVVSAHTEGVILDNGNGTLALTPDEWIQNVSTVLDASGRTLFDEVPF